MLAEVGTVSVDAVPAALPAGLLVDRAAGTGDSEVLEESEALEASELPKPVELELPASLAEGLPSFDPLVFGVVLSPP